MDERLQRTMTALRESEADWAILSGADSIAYALGYAPPVETGVSPFAPGPTLAVIGRDGAAGLLASASETDQPREGLVIRCDGYGRSHALPARAAYDEALSNLLRQLGVGGRIAIEPATHPTVVDSRVQDAPQVDLTPALRRQRMTKTPAEIAALRRCAEVAATGQRRMMETLHPGTTELRLFAEIRSAMEDAAGARIAVAGDLVSGRERTAAMGGWSGPRVIECGDAVISDLAPRVEGTGAIPARPSSSGRPRRLRRGCSRRRIVPSTTRSPNSDRASRPRARTA